MNAGLIGNGKYDLAAVGAHAPGVPHGCAAPFGWSIAIMAKVFTASDDQYMMPEHDPMKPCLTSWQSLVLRASFFLMMLHDSHEQADAAPSKD